MLQTFSLPLAAAMGCCSFEAYNAPYILHGVKEVSPCKTETVYMDRDFMDTLVAGVMEVRLSVVYTAYLPHVPVTAAWCVGGGEMCGGGKGGPAQKVAGMTASLLMGGKLAGHPSLPSSRRVPQHRTFLRLASAGEHRACCITPTKDLLRGADRCQGPDIKIERFWRSIIHRS